MEKLKYGKYNIEIDFEKDDYSESPREWAQGILFGVDKPIREFNEHNEEIKKEYYLFPVYKYEHSMVAFHIGNPTTRGFDTGLFGLMAIPMLHNLCKAQAEEIAKQELYEYECYCNGLIYSYHVFNDDLSVDEYNDGYYYEDDCKDSALGLAKYYTEQDERDAVNFWAKNND